MNKRHIHADFIHAYAEGAEIQYRNNSVQAWADIAYPSWQPDCEYRIKPTPKPDVAFYVNVYSCDVGSAWPTLELAEKGGMTGSVGAIRYVIDGETGKLKSAEVL